MTDSEEAAPEGAFFYMDAARAVAAGLVAISHIRDLLMVPFDSAIAGPGTTAFYFVSGFGHIGVILFFVLSGFWISQSAIRRAGESNFWPLFLIDRLSRLWIVVLPALLLGGVLDHFGMTLVNPALYGGATGAKSMAVGSTAALAPANFVANLLFLQSLILPPFGSNGPMWSLAYEFWFYIWFPALWIAFRFRRFSPALFALGLGALFPPLAVGFLSWLCGAGLYALMVRARHTQWARRRVFARATLLFGVGIFASAALYARSNPNAFDPILAAGFGAFLFGVCLVNPSPLRAVGPVARYGARSSFSLYAIHYPLVALIAGFFTKDGRMPASLDAMLRALAVFVVVVLLAALFSRLTEARTGAVRQRARRWLLGI